MSSSDGNHAEVVEQTYEIIRVAYLLGREASLEFTSHKTILNQLLDDRGIMCKLLVLADEHAEFVVIQSDIFLYHIFRQSSPISYIIINEIEHHIRIIHGGFSVRSLCEAIVVVPWLHQFYQFIHGVVVEIEGIGIVSEHFAHFFLREARHLVKLV